MVSLSATLLAQPHLVVKRPTLFTHCVQLEGRIVTVGAAVFSLTPRDHTLNVELVGTTGPDIGVTTYTDGTHVSLPVEGCFVGGLHRLQLRVL